VIEVARSKGAAPILRNLVVPAGLHIVLFSVGPSISTTKMMAGLRAYAGREKGAFDRAVVSLRDIAQRFVDEIAASSATGAVRAAGDYGDELARLALAADVPIVSDEFAHAATLAREFGGIAKPAAAGGGQIGVALFAASEAAGLFRRACAAPLVALDGDIDRQGVRCQAPTSAGKTDEITLATTTPSPDQQDLGENSERDFEQDFEEDAETAIQGFDLSLMAAVVRKKDTVSASPIEIRATANAVTVQRAKQDRSGLRRAGFFGVALLTAIALIGWLGAARHRARGAPSATFPAPSPKAASQPTHSTAAPDADHAGATTLGAAPKDTDTESARAVEAEAPLPTTGLSYPSEQDHPSTEPPTEPKTGTARTAKRRAHSRHVSARSHLASPLTKKRAKAASPLRAGELSPDDF